MSLLATNPPTHVAGSLPAIGIPLGLLIGVLSGLLSLLFLRTLQIVREQTRNVSHLIAQFVGIPTLWLSVPFGSSLLTSIEPSRLVTSYIITLAIVWLMIVSWPLIRLVIATAQEIRSDDD